MHKSGIIYYRPWHGPFQAISIPAGSQVLQGSSPQSSIKPHQTKLSAKLVRLTSIALLVASLGGMSIPFLGRIRLEAQYVTLNARTTLASQGLALRSYFFGTTLPDWESLEKNKNPDTSRTLSYLFPPLTRPDGTVITPVNTEFSLVIPNIGVNAPIIASVDPTDKNGYMAAMDRGIAHSSLSFTPDKFGTVYLFSHSTNYDWFVNDLNAVFYLLKNLEPNDEIALFYQGNQYRYRITDQKVVSPRDIDYLIPKSGLKKLILQTCWPPGSTTQRLLLFADFVETPSATI
jgi:LPXTG-site transpeptidase (sortase) family protein